MANIWSKDPQDKRPAAHIALSAAGKFAIDEGDVSFLELLLKKGLKVNEGLDLEEGNTLLHEAAWKRKLDIVKFLLKIGADPDLRNRLDMRPIDWVISGDSEDICALLAKPDGNETMVDGTPSGLIEELLPHQSRDEIIFVSWNKEDPTPELLAEIRKTLPHARLASRMTTLERRPQGASSWYQDKESKEFGTLIEVSLSKETGIWEATVRTTTGPSLAGGGWNGRARKKHGYWHTYDVERWAE